MPETSVYEDYASATWKNEIRGARKISAVEPETETPPVKFPPKDQLRLGIP